MTDNPYAASVYDQQNDPILSAELNSAAAIRKRLLPKERRLRFFTILAYLGGFLAIFCSIGFAVTGYEMVYATELRNEYAKRPDAQTTGYILWFVGALTVVFSSFQIWTAYGVSRLRPYARKCAIAVCAVWLLWFFIGTIVAVYMLNILATDTGRYLFSPQYKEVIEQTKEMKSGSSWIVMGLVFLVITVAVGVIIGVLLP